MKYVPLNSARVALAMVSMLAASVILCGFANGSDQQASVQGMQVSVRSMVVGFNPNYLKEFLETLRKFAQVNQFEFQTAQSSPDPGDVIVRMSRKDFDVTSFRAIESNAEESKFWVAVYYNADMDMPEEVADTLINDVWHDVQRVPSSRLVRWE